MITYTEKKNLLQEITQTFHLRGLDIDSARTQWFESFLEKGLPGPKSEEYRFTPVTRILEKAFVATPETPPSKTAVTAALQIIHNFETNVVAFVNGRFSRELSKLQDAGISITLTQPGEQPAEGDCFSLLNQAFTPENVTISIAANKVIARPLAIVYYFDSHQFVFANPRWQCQVGAGSKVTVIEYSSGSGVPSYFNNKHSVLDVAEQAEVEYTMIQNGPATEIQVNNTWVHLASSSRISCFTFSFSGELIRNNLSLTVDGEGIESHLYGLYILSKHTLADNHTVVDHRKPRSFSNEFYKGIMDENSKGVFNGKIFVRPQAQKTNAFQSNRNIILGESATVNTKPQLEIWADDVKCTHGCTTGQLDEEALFYLRSRGISKDLAKGMLLYAFAVEALASMKNEDVRNYVDSLISSKLHKNF